MKFCMLTTFFGSHSFGGDAAFVDRLSRALADHGHEVHVVHCLDAFEASRGDQLPRPYDSHPRVVTHALKSPAALLSPLATHQTGLPLFKARAIRRILNEVRPDVVHFHNLSLIGGPGLLRVPAHGAVKLMTTHEHWLACPLSVLWKFDSDVCEAPECVQCCVQAKRPPQLWRKTGLRDRALRHLDALICPSRSTQHEHARRGVTAPTTHLPYFLPNHYPEGGIAPTPRHERPYVAAVGRLEKIKGFQDAIDAIAGLPHVDLRIAGAGAYEPSLRERASGLPNVHFEGRLDSAQVGALFRGARAVVVPSKVYETFGYVVLEAFHEGTPVIVRDLGALPELVARSQGGIVFRCADELSRAIDRLARDNALRRSLGANGRAARETVWSETYHLQEYMRIINDARRGRRLRADVPHAIPAPHARLDARERLRALAARESFSGEPG